MFYSLVLPSLTLAIVFVLYTLRHRLLPLLPSTVLSHMPSFLTSSGASTSVATGGSTSTAAYTRLPLFDWSASTSAGLSSSLFDIEANIRDGDSRSGLDQAGAEEVVQIMRTQGVTFDQARLIRHNALMRANGIDENGMPMDKKAITKL